MTTSTVNPKHLQPIRHDHLKLHLKTRRHAIVRALQVAILNSIQYDNVEYSNYVTGLSSAELENFINQFDPTEPFKIVKSLKIVDNKIQRLTSKVYGLSDGLFVIQTVLQHLLKQPHISFLKQILNYLVHKLILMKISQDHLPWTQMALC